MADSIEQRIKAVKQEIAEIRQSETMCTSNAEKEYHLLELEDELDELKDQLAEAKQ